MHDADRPIVRIVDDESAVREALAFLLQEEGWDVRLYSSAEDFLAHDPTDRPGWLVLDVKMPGLSGTELHAILRNRGFAVPILFLSAHGDIDMAVQALQKGAVDFIPKPLRPERVLEAVAKAVQNDRDRRDFGMTRDECRARLLRLT